MKRYNRTGCRDIECMCGGDMEEAVEGDYVRYDDLSQIEEFLYGLTMTANAKTAIQAANLWKSLK